MAFREDNIRPPEVQILTFRRARFRLRYIQIQINKTINTDMNVIDGIHSHCKGLDRVDALLKSLEERFPDANS